VLDISVNDVTPEMMSQSVSFVYQNPEEMFIMDSIRGDIEYAMKVRNVENYKERTDAYVDYYEDYYQLEKIITDIIKKF